MIGRLTGIVTEKKPPYLLLDVGGVGYEIQLPMSSFYPLPALGEKAAIHTHLSVSETAQQLFGFYTEKERSLFRTLIKVSGVGPKLALGILSGMEPDLFVQCVLQDDHSALVRVPGVGKKTAERLLVEVKDKLKGWQTQDSQPLSALEAANPSEVLAADAAAEAQSAMEALGYKPTEAKKAIAQVRVQQPDADRDTMIRLALRGMLP